MESQHIFQNRYRLSRVTSLSQPKRETWWMDDMEDKAHRSSLCFCLTPDHPGYKDELRRHLNNIQHYIDRHVAMLYAIHMACSGNTACMPTDESDHYTYLKTIRPGHRYEGVHVHTDRHTPDTAELTHMIVQFEAYTAADLDYVVQGFGYDNLSDFLKEQGAETLAQTLETEDLDCDDPEWLRVADFLAVFLIESQTGRTVPLQQAADFADWFYSTPAV